MKNLLRNFVLITLLINSYVPEYKNKIRYWISRIVPVTKFRLLRIAVIFLSLFFNKIEGKEVILGDGSKTRKPIGLRNSPRIQYTILPKERLSYSDWFERLKSYEWINEQEENPERTTLKIWML